MRVDSTLGRTLGRGSSHKGVRAPKTPRTRFGRRDVLDRRLLEVDPDPVVDPREQKGLPESLPGEPKGKRRKKSQPLYSQGCLVTRPPTWASAVQCV